MAGLRTIAVALDFSPGSALALKWAADLATRVGAALHLVHADVLFHAGADGGSASGTPETVHRIRLERLAVGALGLTADELGERETVYAVVRDVTAEAAILRYASAADADLLVLGTHGRKGIARALLGSVTEACVANAPCPVLSVPLRAAAPVPGPDAPVVVPVDFSERSRSALRVALSFAALYDAPVELVHVVHPVRDAIPHPALAGEVMSPVDPDLREDVRSRLVRFWGEVSDDVLPVVQALVGRPSVVVPAYAAERGAGAVVMGTHGRTGAAHVLVGSVAESTLRRAHCPVLTLKEADLHRPKRVPTARRVFVQ